MVPPGAANTTMIGDSHAQNWWIGKDAESDPKISYIQNMMDS
jgi:hypothetical protein